MGRPAARIGTRKLDRSGYWRVRVPSGLPLSRNGWLEEHRLVLWIKLGAGPHRCHWQGPGCRGEVDWPDLHADHLDHDRGHNVLGNLVPACSSCNSQRGENDPTIGTPRWVEERSRGSTR